ncbi:MAG: metalloregulator ArsR/SmtB family transcription factor [Pseudomonadota bacterium]
MDPLSQAFAALADPTRRAIIARLASGEASFTELAEPHAMSRPAVVKHIKALEKAGLVARSGSTARPVYSLSAGPMQGPSDWLSQYQRFWEGSFNRLDAYVAEVTEQKGGEA